MKILQLPAIRIEKRPVFIDKVILFKGIATLAISGFILWLLFAEHYVWAVGLTSLAVLTYYAFNFYQEVTRIDWTVDELNITLEDIIEDLDY